MASVSGDFHIFHPEDRSSEMIGKISRKSPDLANGHLSNDVGIIFPPGASPEAKAILLGTCLLINSLFFETTQNKSQRLVSRCSKTTIRFAHFESMLR